MDRNGIVCFYPWHYFYFYIKHFYTLTTMNLLPQEKKELHKKTGIVGDDAIIGF